MSTPPANITVVPDEADLQVWRVRITGPVGLYKTFFVHNARELELMPAFICSLEHHTQRVHSQFL